MVNYKPKRMGLLVTDECHNNCDHCGVITNSGHPPISLETMNSYISQAYELGMIQLDIGGGEPSLRDETLDVIRHASSKGMHTVMTTNGSYASNEENALKYARELKSAGLGTIRFSIDKDHMKSISYETYLNAVRGALKSGLGVGICSAYRFSTALENHILLEKLAEDLSGKYKGKNILLRNGKIDMEIGFIHNEGRAREFDREELWWYKLHKKEGCRKNEIMIKSNGDITPCCSFHALANNDYVIGNANTMSLKTAIERVNESIIGSVLMGPRGTERLVNFLEKSGNSEAQKMTDSEYTSFCEFCNTVFSTPTTKELVVNEFNRLKDRKSTIVFGRENSSTVSRISVVVGDERIEFLDFLGPVTSKDYSIAFHEHILRYLEAKERWGENVSGRKEEVEKILVALST